MSFTLAAALLATPIEAAACPIINRAHDAAPISAPLVSSMPSQSVDAILLFFSEPTSADLLRDAENTLSRISNPEVRKQIANFFRRMKTDISRFDLVGLPPIDLRESEDGSAILEWRLRDRRLAFTFETAAGDSGWHFVSSLSAGGLRAFGDFSRLDLPSLLAWTLGRYPRA